MFWDKTLETSTATPTTTRNWIVDDLLGALLLEQGSELHQLWHFHQLFRHLRMTQIPVHQTLLDSVLRDLGARDSLLGEMSPKSLKTSNSRFPFPVCGTRASRICTKGQTPAICTTCAAEPPATHPDKVAGNRRALLRTAGRAPDPWLLLSSVSVERCAKPLPYPSSVPVGGSASH